MQKGRLFQFFSFFTISFGEPGLETPSLLLRNVVGFHLWDAPDRTNAELITIIRKFNGFFSIKLVLLLFFHFLPLFPCYFHDTFLLHKVCSFPFLKTRKRIIVLRRRLTQLLRIFPF